LHPDRSRSRRESSRLRLSWAASDRWKLTQAQKRELELDAGQRTVANLNAFIPAAVAGSSYA
jgi:hypothetical protein